MNPKVIALSLCAAFASAALAQPPDGCDSCGVVQSIRMSTERSQWTPLGSTTPAVVTPQGGMTSGMTQFQIGPQMKNQGMVIVGAAGGAAYAKRPDKYDKPRWDVTVKMDRGGVRIVAQSYEPLFREGDRVRVLGTQVELVNQ